MGKHRALRAARRGDFKKVTADTLARALGPPPTDMYDYGMQPSWVKRARQWVYEQQMPEPVYPIHGWSLGYGGPRSPYTWYVCNNGHREMWGPEAKPEHACLMCGFSDTPPFVEWSVADTATARAGTVAALDNNPELIARHDG